MAERENKIICRLNKLERADQYSSAAFDLLDNISEVFELKASGLLKGNNKEAIAWVSEYYDRVSVTVIAAKHMLDEVNELIHEELI